MVLFIDLEMTIPLIIFPLMETSEVKGHFLSMYLPSIASLGVLIPNPIFFQNLTPLDDLEANNLLEF
jgi:hypothetical protein